MTEIGLQEEPEAPHGEMIGGRLLSDRKFDEVQAALRDTLPDGLQSEALDIAIAVHGIESRSLRDQLMDAYLNLRADPEVPAILRQLKDAGMRMAILSNGSPKMPDAAVTSAGNADLLDAVLSVEEAGIYKPDPRVYRLAMDRWRMGFKNVRR